MVKKIFVVLVAIIGLGFSNAFAQSGKTEPLTWDLNNGTLTISGTGAMPDYGDQWNDDGRYMAYPPWYEYRASIRTVVIKIGVTSIGDWAFWECSNLTSITIPNGIKSFGNRAFSGCESLISIHIPDNITGIGRGAFYGCGLTSVIIPNSAEFIDTEAFMDCENLTSVTIPKSVESIGDWAFSGCTRLTSIINFNPVPVDIGFDDFRGVNQSACTLKVPKGSASVYKNADVWKKFNIVEM